MQIGHKPDRDDMQRPTGGTAFKKHVLLDLQMRQNTSGNDMQKPDGGAGGSACILYIYIMYISDLLGVST